ILSGELDHFPQGEYSHGGEGVLESYKEYFKHDIDLEVLGFVRSVLGRSYRNKLCYCGSGKPIKFCHVERFKNLHHMSRYQLKEDIREMREYLEKD
ncbi:hypothetical protein N9B82_06690, partial [Saprospiraceae bacterium]|nr:hypothetical protein [Saprospiraceae bacterium]